MWLWQGVWETSSGYLWLQNILRPARTHTDIPPLEWKVAASWETPGRAGQRCWAGLLQYRHRTHGPTSHPATYHSLCRNSGQTRSWPQVISYQATPSTARQGVAGQIFMDQFWRLRSLRSGQNTALQSFTRFSPATVCIGLSLFIELSSILTQPCMTNCSIIEQ